MHLHKISFWIKYNLLTSLVLSCPLVVSGLSMGSGAEAEEGSLAGASHPEAVHRIWQCAMWGSAAQPAPFHSSSSLWWCGLPHAPRCFPHVRLHRCSWGTESYPSDIRNVSSACTLLTCGKAFHLFPPAHVNKNRSVTYLMSFKSWLTQCHLMPYLFEFYTHLRFLCTFFSLWWFCISCFLYVCGLSLYITTISGWLSNNLSHLELFI